MTLSEEYRPQTLDRVIGQDKAVRMLERLANRTGFGGRAFWISGASGVGKTTIARIIAGMVADSFWITEYDSADEFTPTEAATLTRQMTLYAGGDRGGRAWIINEAHGLRKPVIRQLLGILERLPGHCVVLFTTTRDGQDSLFEDQIDAHPLLSRCIEIRLTNQGLARPFAGRLVEVANAAGLNSGNGDSLEIALRIVKRCKNNLRAAFQEVESGAMLEQG